MQTEKITPINQDALSNLPDYLKPYIVTETLIPGQRVTVAPWISTEIEYYLHNGEYKTRFKFWYGKRRVKDYYLDNNNQIDLRHSCRRIITLVSTKQTEFVNCPLWSLVEIETVTNSWEQ